MTRKVLNVGSATNDGTGESLRDAGLKINDNFEELYTDLTALNAYVVNVEGNIEANVTANLAPQLFSGDYNDLTNTPTLFSGDYNDLSNVPTLFSGSYNDLTDLPTLFSGDYNDLTNQPTIPTAFSGDYNDLTNQPTIPTATSQLTVDGSLVPDADLAYDLGSPTARFRDLYMSGNSIITPDWSITANAGGGITVGTTNIETVSIWDLNINPPQYVTAIDTKSYGPYSGDHIIWDSSSSLDPVSAAGEGQTWDVYKAAGGNGTRALFSTSTSGAYVNGITGIVDGGQHDFDNAGDNNFLYIGPTSPSLEEYVANSVTDTVGRSSFPLGSYQATYTASNSEVITIQYTVTDNINTGLRDVTVTGFSQSGPFPAGEIASHPAMVGYDVYNSWCIGQNDPTALLFTDTRTVTPGLPPINIYFNDNVTPQEIRSEDNNGIVNALMQDVTRVADSNVSNVTASGNVTADGVSSSYVDTDIVTATSVDINQAIRLSVVSVEPTPAEGTLAFSDGGWGAGYGLNIYENGLWRKIAFSN
jgi:hypothetical protein